MTKDFDLIIFDCDGTLVDSEAICNQALIDLVNAHVSKSYDLDYALAHWAGHTISHVLNMVEHEQKVKLPAGLAARYVDLCNERLKLNLNAVEGAFKFAKASALKFKVCVGSNGERKNVKDSLALCGFSPSCFQEDTIFTRIQVPNGKPAPDLFLLAAEKMGVAPARCLVIEDSATGVRAGVAAGMEVWGFTGVAHDPKSQEKILIEAGATAVYSQFIHMAEKLEV